MAQAPGPFARLFRSSAVAAAAAKAAEEEDKTVDPKGKKAKADNADDADTEEVLDKKVDEAEDEVADPDADPEDTPDPDATKGAKKAKAKKTAADGDDESDMDDEADPKARAIRARERGRIAAIMASDAAAENPEGALHMALSTNGSRQSAIGTLAAMNAGARALQPKAPAARMKARERLDNLDIENPGGNDSQPAQSSTKATADAIILAGKRRRGEA